MLIVVFVVGMIASSNCSRFLVFQICVSTVVVNVSTSSFVFGGNDTAECVSMCCNCVYSFCVKHYFWKCFQILLFLLQEM